MPEKIAVPEEVLQECVRVFRKTLESSSHATRLERSTDAFRTAVETAVELCRIPVTIVTVDTPDSLGELRADWYDSVALLIAGKTYAEIAEIMRCERATAHSWVYRAKVELGLQTTPQLIAAVATGRVVREEED